MTKPLTYSVVLSPLSANDGGGWMAEVPDLPGCMSDGETPVEALNNVQGAIEEWIDSERELGRSIPAPRVRTPVAAE